MNRSKSKSTQTIVEQHTEEIVNPLVNSMKVHCHRHPCIRLLKVVSIKMSILIYFSSSGSHM